MGNNIKKKAPKKSKTSRKNYDSGRIDWGICDSKSLQNEDEQAKELAGMNLLYSGDTFIHPFEDDESDNETTEFSLMGEQERYQIEAKFKRLTDKIRDQ